MLLNIEYIYIIDNNGSILNITCFNQGNDEEVINGIIGNFINGLDSIFQELLNRPQKISRIILNDNTAVIIEFSQKSKQYYVAFTKNYTKFTHQKLEKIKNTLDGINILDLQKDKKISKIVENILIF